MALALTGFDDDQLERFAALMSDIFRPKGTILIKQEEVCRRLSVSSRTVDTLVQRGELEPIRITPGGRGRRFSLDSVEAFIRRCANRS